MFGTQEETDAYTEQAKKEQDAQRTREAFRAVKRSPEGHIMFTYLRDRFFNTLSFIPGQPDATAFNEGQRALIKEMNTLADSVERDHSTITTEEA